MLLNLSHQELYWNNSNKGCMFAGLCPVAKCFPCEPDLWDDGGNIEEGKLVVEVEILISPCYEFPSFLDFHAY